MYNHVACIGVVVVIMVVLMILVVGVVVVVVGFCNFNDTLFNQKSPVHEAPGPGPWHRFIENCLPAYQIF